MRKPGLHPPPMRRSVTGLVAFPAFGTGMKHSTPPSLKGERAKWEGARVRPFPTNGKVARSAGWGGSRSQRQTDTEEHIRMATSSPQRGRSASSSIPYQWEGGAKRRMRRRQTDTEEHVRSAAPLSASVRQTGRKKTPPPVSAAAVRGTINTFRYAPQAVSLGQRCCCPSVR